MLGRQVTRLFVMEREGLANVAPNHWWECHLEQYRDSPRQWRPSSLEVAHRRMLLWSRGVENPRLRHLICSNQTMENWAALIYHNVVLIKTQIFYISFKHGHRSFEEHSRTRTSKPLIRWHLASHKGRIFHANPSIICITHVLILWKIEQLFWCKPATWESPVLYRWQLL